MQHTNVALAIMVSVVLVAPVVTAGGTDATPQQRLQTQDERLDNGTALSKGGGGKYVAGREDDDEMQYVGTSPSG